MTDLNEQLAVQTDAENLAAVANMIDLATETICRVSPEYIEVGNDWNAKRDIAEAIGANILTAIVKEAGV